MGLNVRRESSNFNSGVDWQFKRWLTEAIYLFPPQIGEGP